MNERFPLAKFAVFTVVCLLAAGWLIVTIGNLSPLSSRDPYSAVLADVSGLVVDDAVKVSGVTVGKVTSIDVERGQAVVSFEVDDDVVLGDDTVVTVRWRNTLGLRYLYLEPAGTGELDAGHRFPVEATRTPADLNAFLQRITPVMRALDPEVSNILVRELVTALEGREAQVQQLIADAGDLLTDLAGRSDATHRVLNDGATLMDAYARREAEIATLLDRFADVSETVAGRNDVLIEAIDAITAVEAELRGFLERNDGDIRGLIAELDRATAVLSVNHEDIERILTYTGDGIISYHRISRNGQWFNIRVPGLSMGEETLATERGAVLPPRGPGDPADTMGASWAPIFGLPGSVASEGGG